ncbi:hypothetical protein [Dactylosporangium matsuzakiense]|uniref:hypothetical protein n=1 Tax=Dactylosporangium matsuzakiense TaxID=53360 RepID=UPI0022F2FA62|nr:hypothetical protein [Dactylosporangium matsuzakiense]
MSRSLIKAIGVYHQWKKALKAGVTVSSAPPSRATLVSSSRCGVMPWVNAKRSAPASYSRQQLADGQRRVERGVLIEEADTVAARARLRAEHLDAARGQTAQPIASSCRVVLPAPLGPTSATTRPAGEAGVQSSSVTVRRQRWVSRNVSTAFMPPPCSRAGPAMPALR